MGATEDRVIGSLDLRQALGVGEVVYEPGCWPRLTAGFSMWTRVNLLHDHLVDLLLDAAAMGRSTVERDGVSVAHAARLILIGTMNPEEGELRPQLLDRFGLTVEITAPRDPGYEQRLSAADGIRPRPILRRRLRSHEQELRARIQGPRRCCRRYAWAIGNWRPSPECVRVRGRRHAGRHRDRAGSGCPCRMARPQRDHQT